MKQFRSSKTTKQLLAVSESSALHYCGSVFSTIQDADEVGLLNRFFLASRGQWSPCESDDSQFDKAGIV